MSEFERQIFLAFIWAPPMLLGILCLMVAFRPNKGTDVVIPMTDRVGCGVSGIILLVITAILLFGMEVLRS